MAPLTQVMIGSRKDFRYMHSFNCVLEPSWRRIHIIITRKTQIQSCPPSSVETSPSVPLPAKSLLAVPLPAKSQTSCPPSSEMNWTLCPPSSEINRREDGAPSIVATSKVIFACIKTNTIVVSVVFVHDNEFCDTYDSVFGSPGF